MITINKAPYPCSLSKNKIDFEVQSNMYFDSVQVNPSMEIRVDSFPTLGTHYRWEFFNPENGKKEIVQLVVSTNGAPQGTLPYWTFGGSMEPMVDQIISKLKLEKVFNAWYTISKIGTDTVKIEAKFPKKQLIPIYFTNQNTLHFVHTVDKTTIDPQPRIGYQLKALVYFEHVYNSGIFEMVSAVDMYHDENAIGRFNASTVLDAEIESNWNQYPLPTEENKLYVSSNLKRYYVDFVESWSGEPDQRTTKSDVLFVHWGGASTEDEHVAPPLYLNANENRFLTWMPSGKKVGLNQMDWLSWMNHSDTDVFKVNVRIYTDVQELDVELHAQELKTWESFVFQSGYTQNDLESLVPGEFIRKWEFFITDSALKPISPFYRYYGERSNCFRRTIMYFNSDGMPETFNTSGDWKESTKINATIANRSENFNSNNLFPQSFIFNSVHQTSMKAATGPLTNAETNRLLPLINSMISYVYEKGRWIPVLMNTGNADLIVDNQFIRRIPIEILKANVSDRASYHELMPDLIPIEGCGVERFIIEAHNLEISNYPQMKLYKDEVFVEYVDWNAVNEAYIPSNPIIEPGEYRIYGDLGDWKVNKHFNYSRKRMTAINDQVGTVSFKLQSSNPNETVFVDWGDGAGFISYPYTNVVTTISHNYTVSGKKTIVIEKACFDDVTYIGASNTSLSKLNFSELKNLKSVIFVDSIGDNVYFSANPNIETINLFSSPIFSIDIGYQKNIQTIAFGDLSMSSASLDKLFVELWEYRQFYTNTPSINIVNLGFSPSALVNSIIDGTGDYAGEGLSANYAWTISIV